MAFVIGDPLTTSDSPTTSVLSTSDPPTNSEPTTATSSDLPTHHPGLRYIDVIVSA